MENKTIVVGMSGGVDSSVSALLLKNAGYNVIGLFMHNWEEEENGFCTAEQDYNDVKRVCEVIGIPYYSVNFSKDYMDRVFSFFLEEYKAGRTPNPDVLCNREIKFGPFLDYALSLGADKIATGHYARVEERDGIFYLLKAKDANKDQTYFLNQLNQKQLSKVVFPVGDMLKPDLREIAKKANLVTATKKDSTGICFIGERKFREFLKTYLPAKKGKICDINGKVVGEHEGVFYYTIGQRKGLNIGGIAGGNGERWFVYKKDVKNNILYVHQGDDDVLYSVYCTTDKFNFISGKPADEFDCTCKFRYRQNEQDVHVSVLKDGSTKITYKQKQKAVTPGQYAVLYLGDVCLGGARINEVFA